MTSETPGTGEGVAAADPAADETPDATGTETEGTATEPIATASEPADTATEPVTIASEPAVKTIEPITVASAVAAGDVPAASPEAASAVDAGTISSVSRRNRALGTTGQVAAIVGIVVSLGLVVGVLLGRGWLLTKVDDVAATIDGGLAKGVPLLDNASARVSQVSGRVGAVADAANALAANPNPAPGLTEALLAQMTPISDRYLALRSSYTNVRTTIGSAVDRLNTLDQMLPWFSIPQGPVDALATLDARVQAIDATVTDLLATPGAGAVNAAAAAIATKAENVQTGLTSVTAAIDDASERLAALRVNVQTKSDQVKLIITLGSIVLILGLLYSTFLHWVLFRASSGRRRRTDTI